MKYSFNPFTVDFDKTLSILWKRTGTTLSPFFANDNIDIGSGNFITTGSITGTNANWDNAYLLRVDTWGDGLSFISNIASVDYNSSNLKITSSQLNTIQDIGTTSTPIFNQLTVTNSPAIGTDAVNKDYVDSAIQGLDWQDSVKDEVDFTTAEPSSPSTGDRYINTVTGTSSATSQAVTATYIYEWSGSSWTETVPNEGYAVWVETTDAVKTYNVGAWVTFGSTITHNNLSNKQGGSGSNEFYHLQASAYNNLLSQDQEILTTSSPTFNSLDLSTSNLYFKNTTAQGVQWYNTSGNGTFLLRNSGGTNANLYLEPSANSGSFIIGNATYNTDTTIYGNVGIGITSPADKLYVANGNIGISDNYYYKAGGWNILGRISGDVVIKQASTNDILFQDTSSNNLMVISSSGNVGIGTTSPNELLHIEGSTAVDMRLKATGVNSYARLYLQNDAQEYELLIGSDDKLSFYDYTNLAYRLTIDTSGNVGIGTTTPNAKLQVVGTTKFSNSSGSADSWFPFTDGEVYITGDEDGTGNGDIHFRSYNTIDSYTEHMVVEGTTGNVGIGTTAPTNDLHISGTESVLRIQATATNGKIWDITSGGGGSQSAGVFAISDVSVGTTPFKIYGTSINNSLVVNGSRIGIGTATPVGILDIYSSATASEEVYLTNQNSVSSYQNSNSLRLNFVGKDQTAGYGIQALNVASYGKKDLVFYGHNTADYTTYTETMRLTYNGNLGIGTVPASIGTGITSLDIRGGTGGGISIGNDAISVRNVIYTTATDSYMGTTTNHPLYLTTNNVKRILILGNGNVGIGGSPSDILTVNSDYGQSEGLSIWDISSAYGWDKVFLGAGLTKAQGDALIGSSIYTTFYDPAQTFPFNKYGALVIQGRNDNSGGIDFRTGTGTGYADRMVILSDGNVGIGTASPTGILDIHPASSGAGFVVFNNNVGGSTRPASTGMTFGWNPSGSNGESEIAYSTSAGSAPRLSFSSWDGTATTTYVEEMTLKGGNLGIGTTSPATDLHIGTNFASEPVITLGDVNFQIGTEDNWGGSNLDNMFFEVYDGAGRGFRFRNSSDDSLVYIEGDTGNVGIGTTGPAYKLDVAGVVRASAGAGAFLANSSGVSNSFVADSSTGYWSYLRLESGSIKYDIGVSDTDNSGSLGFRPGGVGTYEMLLSQTGSLSISGDLAVNGGNISVPGVDSYMKYKMWGTSTNYGIGMYSGQSYGGLNDYAMTFTMNNNSNRGWLWRDYDDVASDGAMSLTTAGVLTVKDSITAKSINIYNKIISLNSMEAGYGSWTLSYYGGTDTGETRWYDAGWSGDYIRTKETFVVPAGVSSITLFSNVSISSSASTAIGCTSVNSATKVCSAGVSVVVGGSNLELRTISVSPGDRVRFFVKIGTTGPSFYVKGVYITMGN